MLASMMHFQNKDEYIWFVNPDTIMISLNINRFVDIKSYTDTCPL